MINLNQKGYPNKALNILNELEGMEIGEARELLDWCRDKLLRQPSASWKVCKLDDSQFCIKADCEHQSSLS